VGPEANKEIAEFSRIGLRKIIFSFLNVYAHGRKKLFKKSKI